MNNQKHTPGPWEIATIDNGAAPDEIVAEVNGCTVNVAQVFPACDYSEARPAGENNAGWRDVRAAIAKAGGVAQ